LDALPAVEVSDGSITPESFQDNADLLFGGELTAGEALDILDKLLGLFASGFSLIQPEGFSLPGLVYNLLHHGLLLPLNDNLLLYRYWSKPLSVH
jgi:hypothetical protein